MCLGLLLQLGWMAYQQLLRPTRPCLSSSIPPDPAHRHRHCSSISYVQVSFGCYFGLISDIHDKYHFENCLKLLSLIFFMAGVCSIMLKQWNTSRKRMSSDICKASFKTVHPIREAVRGLLYPADWAGTDKELCSLPLWSWESFLKALDTSYR